MRSSFTTLIFAGCLLFASVPLRAAPEDTTADAVLGQADFTTNLPNQGGAASAATMKGNRGVLVDKDGRLWVADSENNRVLRFADAATIANGAGAELVLGQADLSSVFPNRADPGVINNPLPTANTLTDPRSVAMDQDGRLFVADSGNKRVLRYDPPFATGMNAVQVFGQNGSFTTKTPANLGAATADNLGNPDGVAVDSAGNLYVADLFQKRVLIFNTPAAAGGDTTADIVIGQPNLTSDGANQGGANPTEKTLFNPEGVAIDAQDNLYVADQENHRVLLFLKPLSTNMSASRVFGQPNFTTGTAADPPTASSMSIPVAVAVDPKSGNLYVADSGNNRILEFADPQNDSVADRVFGQGGDFTTKTVNTGGISADSISDVGGVACDANGNLFCGDRNNNRALRFNVAPPPQDPGGGNTGGDNMQQMDQTACGLCGPGMAAIMPMMLLGWVSMKRRMGRSSGADGRASHHCG